MRSSARRAGVVLTRRQWLGRSAVGLGAWSWLGGRTEALGRPRRDEAPEEGRILVVAGNARRRGPLDGLFAIDPKEGTWQKVAEFLSAFLAYARVSPDGRTLALTKGIPGKGEGVYRVDLQGGEPKRLFDRPGRASWSGDGKRLIVSDPLNLNAQRGFQTWRLDADGSHPTRLPLPETDAVLDWSPDGEWLLVASGRDDPDAPVSYTCRPIYVMRPDGTEARRLIEATDATPLKGSGIAATRRFSPDGRKVFYEQYDLKPGGKASYWVVDRDGQDRRRIDPQDNQGIGSPQWAPDGSGLVVTAIASELDEDGKRKRVAGTGLDFLDLDGHRRRIAILPHNHLRILEWR